VWGGWQNTGTDQNQGQSQGGGPEPGRGKEGGGKRDMHIKNGGGGKTKKMVCSAKVRTTGRGKRGNNTIKKPMVTPKA